MENNERLYVKTSQSGKYEAWYCIEDGQFVTYAHSERVTIPQKTQVGNQQEAEQFIDAFVAE
jgi:hypothetical protein